MRYNFLLALLPLVTSIKFVKDDGKLSKVFLTFLDSKLIEFVARDVVIKNRALDIASDGTDGLFATETIAQAPDSTPLVASDLIEATDGYKPTPVPTSAPEPTTVTTTTITTIKATTTPVSQKELQSSAIMNAFPLISFLIAVLVL
jgi:hypothetical protein